MSPRAKALAANPMAEAPIMLRAVLRHLAGCLARMPEAAGEPALLRHARSLRRQTAAGKDAPAEVQETLEFRFVVALLRAAHRGRS